MRPLAVSEVLPGHLSAGQMEAICPPLLSKLQTQDACVHACVCANVFDFVLSEKGKIDSLNVHSACFV